MLIASLIAFHSFIESKYFLIVVKRRWYREAKEGGGGGEWANGWVSDWEGE